MSTEVIATIPHPDIELGFERHNLTYFLTYPENGVNSDTGLILSIPGFADRADSEYQTNKLRPYLANKYNCLVAGVNYFGIQIKAAEKKSVRYKTSEFLDWILYSTYGIDLKSYVHHDSLALHSIADALKQRGIKRLDPACCLIKEVIGGDYQSFGFLPAIDHLQVVGEILEKYNINKRKIIAFGSSYGGYITLLLGKYAPRTFSVIIDNSGFVKTNSIELLGRELNILRRTQNNTLRVHNSITINGVDFPYIEKSPWTIIDENSPFYFSDSHRYIRSLLQEFHIERTSTRYYIFHSEQDDIVPVEHKDKFVKILQDKSIELYYKRVNESDIDGRVFKTIEHAMKASLRGIFDMVADLDSKELSKDDDLTDFDLNSIYAFDCADKSYVFSFNNDFTLKVELVGKKV